MNTSPQLLRVAVVASSLKLGGAEKQAFYITRCLHRAGIEVQFFHLGGGGHFETDLLETGVAFHRIYLPNRPLLMLAKLTAALCRWRPQIVLSVQFGDLRYAIPAGRICRALVLGGIRSDGFYELKQHGRWSRWMFRLADGLISNSFQARKNLVSQKINPQKIEVLSNVIDLPEFDRRRTEPLEMSLPANRIIVAAVGNLHACKRFDRFIGALALARRSEPSLAGVIAGTDYGVKVELQAQANALGLTPRDLVFLGKVGNIPALLARSAMLALTSDYEGFPNVILEAMAARLPVISTRAGDAALVVQNEKTGFVVERDDTQSLAAFMVQLAQSPALRKKLGEAGRRRVEREYNCEPLAERLLAVFHHFAGRQRKFSLCESLEHGAPAELSETPFKAGNAPMQTTV